MRNIAVVVPSIRPDSLVNFAKAWQPIFQKHNVEFITVLDGKEPKVLRMGNITPKTGKDVMEKYKDCLTNFTAAIRNLGFAYVAKYLPDVEYIITLDDDEVPIGDPIQDHIDALERRVPVSWLSTASEYTRGFPYKVRDEAEVVLSHGVWEGVADWDAPTQLVKGASQPISFYKGPIPKGIFYPMCIMNVGFKRKMLPYIFQAPKALGIHRFDDIFAGIYSKRIIDKKGWAVVTGYSRVLHERASDVFKNLRDEAPGIELNETYWQGDEKHEYFKIYKEKREMWEAFISQYVH